MNISIGIGFLLSPELETLSPLSLPQSDLELLWLSRRLRAVDRFNWKLGLLVLLSDSKFALVRTLVFSDFSFLLAEPILNRVIHDETEFDA